MIVSTVIGRVVMWWVKTHGSCAKTAMAGSKAATKKVLVYIVGYRYVFG